MKELQERLKEIKKELRPMNLVSIVAVAAMLVGAVLVLVGAILNKQNKGAADSIFFIGIGIMATVVVLHLSACIVNRKLISEQYKIEKEIRQKKKESK